MWNLDLMPALSDRSALVRGLELSLYAVLGGLFIAQLFPGDAPITLGQAIVALTGEAVLALVATASAPVSGLLARREGSEIPVGGQILPFRRRSAEPVRDDRDRRAA